MLQLRTGANEGARNRKESSMINPDLRAQVRQILEEELGEFRSFSEQSASEIEAMAARLTRALEPVLAVRASDGARRDAA
jgi:hypothetical protein